MKNFLKLILNIIIFIFESLMMFFEVLWYGKLPKVSVYHRFKHSSLFERSEVYNNVNSQVFSEKCVPTHIKQRIIEKYITDLYNNQDFQTNIRNISIPLFDGKEVVGETTVYNIFEKVKNEQQ